MNRAGHKAGVCRSDNVFLEEFGLGPQQIELPQHDDECDKGSQTADARGDPMRYFQPDCHLATFVSSEQRVEHKSDGNA
jgi:hypothetical protein